MQRFSSAGLSLAVLVSMLLTHLYPVHAQLIDPIGQPAESKVSGILSRSGSSRHNLSTQSSIKVDAQSLTITTFIPLIIRPKCTHVSGQVLSNSLPLSGTRVDLSTQYAAIMYPSLVTSTLTDAAGNYFMNCLEEPQGETYNIEVYGDPGIGQIRKWTSLPFILGEDDVVLPPIKLERLYLVDPIGDPIGTLTNTSSVVLPYTFVWTSTFTNAVYYSLIFPCPLCTAVFNYGNTLTGTVEARPSPNPYFRFPLYSPASYSVFLRIYTPDGIGESGDVSVNISTP